MNIANVSIKKPVFITVIMMVLTILGFICYGSLELNDMPNTDLPYVTVSVVEPGATPETIETKVTKQVEDAVQKISGVQNITSIINEGMSITIIEFDLSKDGEVAAQEVRDKVSTIRGDLPTDINDPIISKFDMSASSIVSIAVYGSEDNKEMSDFVEDVIKPKLYTVSGVGSIDVSGENTREIHIKLDNDKLLAYGLTSGQVVNSIKTDNIDQSTGKVTDGNNEVTITTNSKIKKIEDFKNILVTKKNGTEIRLKDVAKVEDGFEERSNSAFYQGNEAIGIDIVKQSGANTVEVAEGVKKALEQIKTSLPEGIHVDIVSDNSVTIEDTVNDVMKTIIEGCILAIIIVFIFLNEWESTLISAMSLPISIITSFIGLKLMDFSLNSMSLMALSLAVGLLVDDAIVVIENIVRHLHMGKSPIKAAAEATSEIGFAVIATTLAVIAVFLPIGLVEGIIGKMIIEFSLTIVISMAVSLFVSFTLVPMMSAKMLKTEKKESKTFIGKFFIGFNNKFDAFAEKYSHLLVSALHHRLIVLICCVVMFVASLGLATLLGFNIMPSTDQGKITVSADFDAGITLDTASEKTKQLEEIIKKHPEVVSIYSTVSKTDTSITVELVDKNEREYSSRELAEILSTDLKAIPGTEATVTAASMSGGTTDVSFNIVSDDREKLQEFADEMKKEISKDPAVRDVTTNSNAGTPQAQIVVDRDKAADLGVSSSDVASTLSILFNGSDVNKYDSGDDRYNVRISLEDEERNNLDNLDEIYVSGSNYEQIPLSQVTKKVIGTTSSSLNRYNKQAQVEISFNVNGNLVGDAQSKYMAMIQSKAPDGISLSLGGTNGMMQEGVKSLLMAMVLSVLLLYLVMAAQFESFIDPISIMFTLPLAFIGAIIGLFVFGNQLSMMAMIGLIMLFGLVSKNGILLIDAAKERIEAGMPRNEAIKEAGLVRLRPIIMTTLAMILGMVPTAVATGAGTEMRAPMGQAVIGGLITSTILTLFVVPIMYTILDDLKVKIHKVFHRKSSKAEVKVEEESNLTV